jgi:hypothetical protein
VAEAGERVAVEAGRTPPADECLEFEAAWPEHPWQLAAVRRAVHTGTRFD